MKKILFLLLLSVTAYGQVPADATPLENVQITNNVVSTGAPSVVVQETNGVINKINKGDVIEYLEFASAVNLPVTGVAGKLYLTRDNNRLYRWNGTIYVEVTVDISGKENTANKQNSLVVDGTGVKFPTVDAVRTHTTDTNNPHAVTKAQVGLANVDNTSDLNKPISTATQTAIDDKINGNGSSPTIALFTGPKTVGNSVMIQDLNGNIGVGTATPFNLAGFRFVSTNAVNGSGFSTAVNTTPAIRFASNTTDSFIAEQRNLPFRFINNGIERFRLAPTTGNALFNTTTDNNQGVIQANGNITASAATLANQVVIKSQLDLKADLASPSFTGTLSGQAGNFSGAFQANSLAISGGTASQFLKANGTVDATVYAPLASPALEGTPTAPTATAGTNTTQIATTAFVTGAITTADAGNVKLTGNQTIAGQKTFNNTSNPTALILTNGGVSGGILSISNSNNLFAVTGTQSGTSGQLFRLNGATGDNSIFSANGQVGNTGNMFSALNNGTVTFSVKKEGIVSLVGGSSLNNAVPRSQLLYTNQTITENKTVTISEFVNNNELILSVDATSGNITITLPTFTALQGYKVTVKKMDSSANTVSITGIGGVNIDGASTLIISGQYGNATVGANLSQYIIL